MEELKPCPFCNREINNIMLQIGHKHDCFLLMILDRESRHKTDVWIKAWNTRTDD